MRLREVWGCFWCSFRNMMFLFVPLLVGNECKFVKMFVTNIIGLLAGKWENMSKFETVIIFGHPCSKSLY